MEEEEVCYHYTLGKLLVSSGHTIQLGHMWKRYVESEYLTIVGDLNWTYFGCGMAQHGDGTCCGKGAKEQLVNRFKEFSAIASSQYKGKLALDVGKVKTLAEFTKLFLSPHGRSDQGLIPDRWKAAD